MLLITDHIGPDHSIRMKLSASCLSGNPICLMVAQQRTDMNTKALHKCRVGFEIFCCSRIIFKADDIDCYTPPGGSHVDYSRNSLNS